MRNIPRDAAGNHLLSGSYFAKGRPDLKIKQNKKGQIVIDAKGGYVSVNGGTRENASKVFRSWKMFDQKTQTTPYDRLVEDLDPEDSKYMCIYFV